MGPKHRHPVFKTARAVWNFGEVANARIGKVIELDLEGVSEAEAETRVKDMCEKLLANTVIESYRVELVS